MGTGVGTGAGLGCLWRCLTLVGVGDAVTVWVDDGVTVGVADTAVGVTLGMIDTVMVGVMVGLIDLSDGLTDGLTDGLEDGLTEGLEDGLIDGLAEGLIDGLEDGLDDGLVDGLVDGLTDGLADGVTDGAQLVGAMIVSSSRVTAPVLASMRPVMMASCWTAIDVRARTLPSKTASVSSVAELPTCQKMLQALMPPLSKIVESTLAVSVEAAWKTNTEFASPARCSVPLTASELVEL